MFGIKRVIRKAFSFVNNFSLQKKLFIVFLIVALVPVLIITITSSRIFTENITERELEREQNILQNVRRYYEQTISEVALVGIRLSLDESVQSLLSRAQMSAAERLKTEFDLQKQIMHYRMLNLLGGTDSIYLYGVNGATYSNGARNDEDVRALFSEDWFLQGIANDSKSFWGEAYVRNGRWVVPHVRIIQSIKNSEVIGACVLVCRVHALSSAYQAELGNVENRRYLIADERGDVLSASHDQDLGANIFEVLSIAPEKLVGTRGGVQNDLGRDGSYLVYQKNPNSELIYISAVPMSDILTSARSVSLMAVLLSAGCFLLCLLVLFLLLNRITRPINKLIIMMSRAQAGDFEVRFHADSNDEIGRLGTSFNLMLARIQAYMEENIRVQRLKREADIKVLENQINPHFLYNTMNSIVWLAKENRNEEVISTTMALSNFFRISLNRGNEVVSVQEELSHVQNYVEVQKMRYGADVLFIFDVDYEMYHYFTIKLILQPIVENAIYHGIKKLSNQKGIIKIEGQELEDALLLRVCDNGPDIGQEKIFYLNEVLEDAQPCPEEFGIGIRNVNNRLKLYYGAAYGLHFSRQGNYTVVEMKLPKVTNKEEIHV